MLKSIPTTFISTNADTFMIHYFSSFVVILSRNRMEEYPSGWRGGFAKAVGGRKLSREFESLLLRQEKISIRAGMDIFF